MTDINQDDLQVHPFYLHVIIYLSLSFKFARIVQYNGTHP
jgi:hypothetical protein